MRYRLPIGGRTLIMAIVNVTPDSFSGDGYGTDVDAAVEAGALAEAHGADLVDVGGESTRPRAAEPVGEEEEMRRVVPVIRKLARRVSLPISVDTSKLAVAKAALDAGASIINDVSGMARSDDTARLAARVGAGLVLMRFPGFPLNRPRPRASADGDLLDEVRRDLVGMAHRAIAAGVLPEQIAVDPGFGFGLIPDDSLALLRRLSELQGLAYPLLVGVSRKSFTGQPHHLPVKERAWGTAAAQTLAIAHGADILRAHDVLAARRLADFTDEVVRRLGPLSQGDAAGGTIAPS